MQKISTNKRAIVCIILFKVITTNSRIAQNSKKKFQMHLFIIIFIISSLSVIKLEKTKNFIKELKSCRVCIGQLFMLYWNPYTKETNKQKNGKKRRPSFGHTTNDKLYQKRKSANVGIYVTLHKSNCRSLEVNQ